MSPHRYRASRLSLDAGKDAAAGAAEEDTSDASSEASDMLHIMAGDPAEAAAADAFGYVRVSSRSKSSPLLLSSVSTL